jgi:hypothetical protein
MLRYVHHTPKSASGRSYLPGENMRSSRTIVNNDVSTRGPLRVKSDGLAVGRSLPVYPYQQTSSDANGKSQKCHERTHAPQQIAKLPGPT